MLHSVALWKGERLAISMMFYVHIPAILKNIKLSHDGIPYQRLKFFKAHAQPISDNRDMNSQIWLATTHTSFFHTSNIIIA